MSETRSAFHPRPVYVAASYMSRVGKYNGAHLEALTFVGLAEQVVDDPYVLVGAGLDLSAVVEQPRRLVVAHAGPCVGRESQPESHCLGAPPTLMS